MVEYNHRKEATKMADQKNYKFLIVVNHDDCTNTKELQSMTTREARNYASKLAQLRGIDSVELYRIDKTEIFA